LADELAGELQELPDCGSVVVLHAVRPERVVIHVPLGEDRDRSLEKRFVLHPPGDAVEIHAQQVFGFEEIERVVFRAELRDVVPRAHVEFARLANHDERERSGIAEHFAAAGRGAAGHLHRVMGEFSRLREIKAIFDRLRVVRIEIDMHAAGIFRPGHGQCPGGDLQQHVHFFLRRRGIGHHDVAAVDCVDQEFIGDELIDLLAVLLAILIAGAEEILAHQNRRMLGHFRGREDFFVEDDHRAAGRER
jgi:hypothetical protein